MLVLVTLLVLLAGFGVALALRVKWIERRFPPEGEFAEVGGCRLRYWDRGAGTAVLLLHGTAGSLEDFAQVFHQLTAEFRVIALDRPGHGYSQRPAGDIGTPLAQARVAHEFVKQLGVERAIVVGHSWSGALALAYALEFPAATAGVVLVEGTIYPQEVIGSSLGLLNTPVLGPLVVCTIMPFVGPRGIRRSLERAFHPDPVPPNYLARAQAMWTRPGQALALAEDTKRRAETIDELSQRYGQLTVPLSLVVGTADTFIDPEGQLLRLAREIPAARLHLVPGCGHQVPQTRPEAIVDAVRALAREIESVLVK